MQLGRGKNKMVSFNNRSHSQNTHYRYLHVVWPHRTAKKQELLDTSRTIEGGLDGLVKNC